MYRWRPTTRDRQGKFEDANRVHSISKMFDYTKGIIRSWKSNKDRQHYCQKKRDKKKNNYLQNTTHKTTDWETRTQHKTIGEVNCTRMVNSPSFTINTQIHEIWTSYCTPVYVNKCIWQIKHEHLYTTNWSTDDENIIPDITTRK